MKDIFLIVGIIGGMLLVLVGIAVWYSFIAWAIVQLLHILAAAVGG